MPIWGIAAKITKETEAELRKAAARGGSLSAEQVVRALDILADTGRKLSLAEKIKLEQQAGKAYKQWIETDKYKTASVTDTLIDKVNNSYENDRLPKDAVSMAMAMGNVISDEKDLLDEGYVAVKASAGAAEAFKHISEGLSVSAMAKERADAALKQIESFKSYCSRGTISEDIANGQAFKKAVEIIEKGCGDLEEALAVRDILKDFYERQDAGIEFLKQHEEHLEASSVMETMGQGSVTIFRRNDVPYPHPAGMAVFSDGKGAVECVSFETEKDIAVFCRENRLPDYELWTASMCGMAPETNRSWADALENSANRPLSLSGAALGNLMADMNMEQDAVQNMDPKKFFEEFDRRIEEERSNKPMEHRQTGKFIQRHKSAEVISRNDPDRFRLILGKIEEIERHLNDSGIKLADMTIRSSITTPDSYFNLDPSQEKVNGEQLYIYLQTTEGIDISITYDEAFSPGSVMVEDGRETGLSIDGISERDVESGSRCMIPIASVKRGIEADAEKMLSAMDERLAGTLGGMKDFRTIIDQHEKYMDAKQKFAERHERQDGMKDADQWTR